MTQFMRIEDLKVYQEVYDTFRERYLECVRMLNGLERKLETLLPPESRHWGVPTNAPPLPQPEP